MILIKEQSVPDYWVSSKSNPMTIMDFAEYEAKIEVPDIKVDGTSVTKNDNDELQAISIKNGFVNIADVVERSDFKSWTQLSQKQFDTLVKYGSIVVNDELIEYTDDGVYVTPDTSYSMLIGDSEPTQETEGEPGQFYLETTDKKLYLKVDDNEWQHLGVSIDVNTLVAVTTYNTLEELGPAVKSAVDTGKQIKLLIEFNGDVTGAEYSHVWTGTSIAEESTEDIIKYEFETNQPKLTYTKSKVIYNANDKLSLDFASCTASLGNYYYFGNGVHTVIFTHNPDGGLATSFTIYKREYYLKRIMQNEETLVELTNEHISSGAVTLKLITF
jgi:hypothetical protein